MEIGRYLIRSLYLLLLQCSLVICGNAFNSNRGQCYWWSYANSFVIRKSSLDLTSIIIARKVVRSFVECCMTCDVSNGCSGVVYREDGECNTVASTVAELNSTVDNSSSDVYRVMMYQATALHQVGVLLQYLYARN